MIGGPSIVFCGYAKVGRTGMRPHHYENAKTCERVVGFDANSLYLYCSRQEMLCGKEEYVKVENPKDPIVVKELCGRVMNNDLFGYLQVDIHVFIDINDPRNKKLLGILQAEKILLYMSVLKWYLSHGLKVTWVHRYLKYVSGRPFSWFPEEVSSTRQMGIIIQP